MKSDKCFIFSIIKLEHLNGVPLQYPSDLLDGGPYHLRRRLQQKDSVRCVSQKKQPEFVVLVSIRKLVEGWSIVLRVLLTSTGILWINCHTSLPWYQLVKAYIYVALNVNHLPQLSAATAKIHSAKHVSGECTRKESEDRTATIPSMFFVQYVLNAKTTLPRLSAFLVMIFSAKAASISFISVGKNRNTERCL